MDNGFDFSGRISDYIDKSIRSVGKTVSTERSSVDSLDYALKTLKQASVMAHGHSSANLPEEDTYMVGAGPLDMAALGESESERSMHSRSHSPEGVGSYELTGSIEMQNKKLHRKVHSLEKELDLLQRKFDSQVHKVEIQTPVDVTIDNQYIIEMTDSLFKLSEELDNRRKQQEEEQKVLESEIAELEAQKKRVKAEWTTLKDTSMMIEFRKKQYDRKLKKFKQTIVQSRESMRDSRKEIEKYVKQQWYRLKKMTKEFEEKLVNKIKAKKDEVRAETKQEREKLTAEFELKRETLLQELEKRESQVEEQARRNVESRKRIEKLKEELKSCEVRIKSSMDEEKRKIHSDRMELQRMRSGMSENPRASGNPPKQARNIVKGCKIELEEVKDSMGKFVEIIDSFVNYFSSTMGSIEEKMASADRMQKQISQSAPSSRNSRSSLIELEGENDELGGEKTTDSVEGFEVEKERERLVQERAQFQSERDAFLEMHQFFESDLELATLSQKIAKFQVEKDQLERDKEKLKFQTIEFEQILKEKQHQFEQAQETWQSKLERERATINRLKTELLRVSSRTNNQYKSQQTSI